MPGGWGFGGGGGAAAAETDPVAGPALTTHAALTTTAHGGVVASSDSRLTDTRTPTDSSVTNAKVNSAAAITYGKLALTNAIVNADIASAAAIAYSKLTLTGSIVDADVAAGAAIAKSKLAALAIANADVSSSAAIAYSKLALTGAIVNADISSSAAIALSKLATDPLARANHTGTQTASTVSDFDTQVATTALLKSLADAKGDVFAATADNTVARVAVGTNDQVLVADSTATPGVKWAARQGIRAPAHRSTYWYFPYPVASVIGVGAALSLNLLQYVPVFVDASWAIDRVGIWINSNVSTAVIRVGLYDNTHASGMAPGALIEEVGSIDCSTGSGGVQTVTPATGSRTLTPGIYWLGIVPQVVSANVQRVQPAYIGAYGQSSPTVTPAAWWADSGTISGSLPNPAVPIGSGHVATPGVQFRTV
jgi:hypothetical protein